MKKLLAYIPFHILVFLVFGILIEYQFSLWKCSNIYLIVALLFGMVLLKFLTSKSIVFVLSLYAISFLLGVSITHNSDSRNKSNYFENILNNDVHQTSILEVNKVLKPTKFSNKYEVEVREVGDSITSGKAILNIRKDSVETALYDGDMVIVEAKFQRINNVLNPHQFDYKEYLAKQNIYYQVYISDKEFLRIENTSKSITNRVSSFRNRIQISLQKLHFSDNSYSVINALLLGQRQEINKELISNFSKAGAIHILAVSGLHIGIILVLLNFLLKPLEYIKKGKFIKLFLIVVFLWLYAILAGLSASVIRAVSMFTALALGLALNRKNSVEYSLVISMLILLLSKPLFIFDVGFQLSYLAVFGIVWVQPKLYRLWKPKYWLLDKAWSLTTVSIAAQFGVLPLSLYYFHQFPGLFLLSNLVIIPLLGAILLVGFLVILLSLLNVVPDLLINLYDRIINSLNFFVSWVSQQEAFLFTNISFSFEVMMLSYICVVLGFSAFLYKNYKLIVAFLIGVFCLQGVVIFEKYESKTKKEFIVFHQSRNQILVNREGVGLDVFSNLDSIEITQNMVLNQFLVGEKLNEVNIKRLPKIYQYNNHHILRVDSLGIYKIQNLNNPIVLLQESPTINLERLIKTLNPKQIVADGSNYKSRIAKWKEVSKRLNIPFWYTGDNGAFILN